MTTRKQQRAQELVNDAGVDASVVSLEPLGIGCAGLSARGPRDEDGTHDRVVLEDGTSFIYREYATTTKRADFFRIKEASWMESLGGAGLPTPTVLASAAGGVAARPPALLLENRAGQPLEEVFLEIDGAPRSQLWSMVGGLLRDLHSTDIDVVGPWTDPPFRETADNFVRDLTKTLRTLKAAHPDLSDAIDALGALRPALRDYLRARLPAIRFGEGYYLPGMLVERAPRTWVCHCWLSWGYYAVVGDPMRDVVAIDLAHREFTGDPVPASFYDAYGLPRDPACQLIYEAYLQFGRGSAYVRPNSSVNRRNRPGPPPHSTAVDALFNMAQTVDELDALL